MYRCDIHRVNNFLQLTFHNPAEVTLTSKQVVSRTLNKLVGNTVLPSVVSGGEHIHTMPVRTFNVNAHERKSVRVEKWISQTRVAFLLMVAKG